MNALNWSLSTIIKNPNRIPPFIWALIDFEWKEWDKKTQEEFDYWFKENNELYDMTGGYWRFKK